MISRPKIFCGALCALLITASGAQASTVDERLAELQGRYLDAPKHESRSVIAAVSDDVAIRSGDWTLLARKYGMSFIEGEPAPVPSATVLASWWEQFGDRMMSNLVLMALQRNRDLISARARVTEARAALGISKSALLPWLDATGSWTNSDPSENGSQAASGAFDLYKLGIDASWEIDVFGGRSASVRASIADLAASYAALHSAWVSLSAEVALNYITLCTLHERMAIATANLQLQSETLEILQSQYDSGLTDGLALNQAKYTYEQTEAMIPPLRASIESTMNALSILIGEVPGSLEELLRRHRMIPRIANVEKLIGIPAEGLRRRPDIFAAEMQYIAQTARTRSARADLYPKFRLIGSIGLESFSTGSLFDGASFGYSILPQITWPIFHAGAIRNNIRVQSAREEQLLAAYEGTVLRAVAEVRDAITSHEQELLRGGSLRRGVQSARTALDIARDKYRNGLTDFYNVVSAQSALLSLEDQQVISEGAAASSVVRLFKALGGGWSPLAKELTE